VRLLHDDASVALGRNLSFYVHCVTWAHTVPSVIIEVRSFIFLFFRSWMCFRFSFFFFFFFIRHFLTDEIVNSVTYYESESTSARQGLRGRYQWSNLSQIYPRCMLSVLNTKRNEAEAKKSADGYVAPSVTHWSRLTRLPTTGTNTYAIDIYHCNVSFAFRDLVEKGQLQYETLLLTLLPEDLSVTESSTTNLPPKSTMDNAIANDATPTFTSRASELPPLKFRIPLDTRISSWSAKITRKPINLSYNFTYASINNSHNSRKPSNDNDTISPRTNSMSVCVSGLYLNHYRYLREMVQLYVLQGVSHVYVGIYNSSDGANVSLLLYDFMQEGYVSIVLFNLLPLPKVFEFEMFTKEPFLYLCVNHAKNYDGYAAIADGDEWFVANTTEKKPLPVLVEEEAIRTLRATGKLLCTLVIDGVIGFQPTEYFDTFVSLSRNGAPPTTPTMQSADWHYLGGTSTLRNDLFDVNLSFPHGYTQPKSIFSTWANTYELHVSYNCQSLFETQVADAASV
jgi:hypothetical protein